MLVAALVATNASADGGAATGASSGDATQQRVHVHGSARIDAHAARAAGKLVVSGTVVDDTARPIPGARVAISLARGTSPAGVATFSGPGASPEPCAPGATPPVLDRADLLIVATDDAARFCVKLSLPVDRYVVHIASRPAGLVDPAGLDLAVDLALEPVTLRFDPERHVLALDEEGPGAAEVLEVVASTEDDGVTTAAVGIPLSLANEAGSLLGSTVTNASGRARFPVAGASLGAPGRGTLRVSFAGSAEAGSSTQEMQVERRTHVDLDAPGAVDGRVAAGSPEEGTTVVIRARPRCARRGCVATPTGTVEARFGDAIVGAAPLVAGEARVVVTFAAPAANDVPLRFRYVPDTPWFQAGAELGVTLPVRAPSPWKKIPLVLAGLAVIAWLVAGRLPPRDRSDSSGRPSRAPHPPEAGVELVRAGPAAGGWRGRLHDAHEGTPISGARIAVERPAFDRVQVLAQVVADAQGTFALPAIDASPGDTLVAEGTLHAPLRRPLPHPGELDVALVLRRRALLDRLVAWSRRRGRPFDAKPEPTPGHVKRVAAAEFAVARWADAVERAAYGGGVVDAHAQSEVDRLAPADAAERIDGRAEGEVPPRPGPR
jgi:hypothetical protein